MATQHSSPPRNLARKTVTVIGGTGFVGRAIIEKLAKAEAQIIILARNGERAKRLKPLGDVGQISVIAGNALDEATLRSAIAPADCVINLVGILAPSGTQTFDATQAKLPEMIARIASETGVEQLVHLSAIGADAKSPSQYARTKAEGERGLLRQFPDAVILRPSIIFGAGDGFFTRFGQMAMIAPALPLIGGGKNVMQPVYVGDVADAVMAVLQQGNIKGDIFELGGPAKYSFAELMRFTLKAVGRKRALVNIPFAMMALPAAFASLLPNPPVTSDQLKLLKIDNVVSAKAKGLEMLGITPKSIDVIVPEYLAPFKPGGRFG